MWDIHTEVVRLSADDRQRLLNIIRSAAVRKDELTPALLTRSEWEGFLVQHPGTHVYRGLESVWTTQDSSDDQPVVIRKLGGRDSEKPFLAFLSADHFLRYGKCCRDIGTCAYYLVEEWMTPRLYGLATRQGLSDDAVDEARSAIEYNVGIHWDLPDHQMTDEHLFRSLCAYIAKTATNQTERIYSKLSRQFVYIDAYTFDFLSDEDGEEPLGVISDAYSDSDEVDYGGLVDRVTQMITALFSANTSGRRYDIKDHLLPQIIVSVCATHRFLKEYYAGIEGRAVVWRPVVLGYQVVYSHEHGSAFLKNPRFIVACGQTTLGAMIDSQIGFCAGEHFTSDAMKNTAERMQRESLMCVRLSECAASSEQIGKALSKELRTAEAIEALAKALPFAAAEKDPDIKIILSSEDEVSQHE